MRLGGGRRACHHTPQVTQKCLLLVAAAVAAVAAMVSFANVPVAAGAEQPQAAKYVAHSWLHCTRTPYASPLR